MALSAIINETKFGVGDVVRVHQYVIDRKGDEEKKRTQVFEGTVIGIKGQGTGKSFTVRRIGAQKIGIEQIYPVISPVIEKVEVVRRGIKGVKQAKLYYIRNKSNKEIEKIFTREVRKDVAPVAKKKIVKKAASVKKASK